MDAEVFSPLKLLHRGLFLLGTGLLPMDAEVFSPLKLSQLK